jgi:hypothetical protein
VLEYLRRIRFTNDKWIADDRRPALQFGPVVFVERNFRWH